MHWLFSLHLRLTVLILSPFLLFHVLKIFLHQHNTAHTLQTSGMFVCVSPSFKTLGGQRFLPSDYSDVCDATFTFFRSVTKYIFVVTFSRVSLTFSKRRFRCSLLSSQLITVYPSPSWHPDAEGILGVVFSKSWWPSVTTFSITSQHSKAGMPCVPSWSTRSI